MVSARLLLSVGILLLLGCAEQIPLARGELLGIEQPALSSWKAVAADNIIQFETQSDEGPYSVNLWTVLVDDRLHVFAGDNYASWVAHIEKNASVRMQSGDAIYRFQAERVTSKAVFQRFSEAWEEKYGNQPRNNQVDETYLFGLTPVP